MSSSKVTDIRSKLAKILEHKSSIKSALIEKGAEVPEGTTLREYPDKLAVIRGMGKYDAIYVCENGFADSVDLFLSASSIYSGIFTGTSVSRINFPFVEVIASSTFYNCTELATVSLPLCSIIYASAFNMCSSLKSVHIPMCQQIYSYAFYGCISLESLNAPSLEGIGSWAFCKCHNLSIVSLPKLANLEAYAFVSCSALTTVSLPLCWFIGSSAFRGCINLSEIYFKEKICTLSGGSNVFLGTGITSSTGAIYVPESHYSYYVSSSYYKWSYFKNRIFSYSTEEG